MGIDAHRSRRLPSLRLRTATLLVAMGTLVACAASNLAPLAARAAAPPDAPRALRLVAQTPWVELGGDVELTIAIDPPSSTVADLDLVVRTGGSVGSRTALQAVLDGGRSGDWQASLGPFPVAALTERSPGERVLRVGTQDPRLPRDAARMVLRGTGVFPLEIRLVDRSTGAPVASARTLLTAIKRPQTQAPLLLALLWRVGRETGVVRPDGSITGQRARELAEEVEPVAVALGDEPSVPASILVEPPTLEALALASGGGGGEEPAIETDPGAGAQPASPPQRAVVSLRTRIAGGALHALGSGYRPEALGPLVTAGLAREARLQVQSARAAQGEVLGAAGEVLRVPGPLTGDVVEHLARGGTKRVVVDAGAVAIGGRFTPARPFTLAASARGGSPSVTAVRIDGELSSRASDEALPASVRAAHLVAGATVTALEQPAVTRGVAVEVRTGPGQAGAALVRAVEQGVRSNPLLEPVSIGSLVDAVPVELARGRPVIREPSTVDAPVLSGDPDALRSARARITSFATLAGSRSAVVRQAERALLMAESADGGDSDDALEGALGVVRDAIDDIEGPAKQTVTLIGSRAKVPVTFVNRSAAELRVEVRLQSDKLLFPEGRRRAVALPPKSTTTSFLVEARTRGSFPLFVTITSPDGEIVVSRSEITIRSTATSWVGRVLTAGAAAFLLAWWGLHFRSTRRRSTLA